MQKTTIELKLLCPELFALLPKYGTSGSAAIDLRAAIKENIMLKSGECNIVPTGVAIHISDPSLAGMILPRSGLGHKKGLILGNGVGLIDSDYQGEIMVSCWNRSDKVIKIKQLMRFAQLVIIPVVQANFVSVENFSDKTKRSVGCFGHTGTN